MARRPRVFAPGLLYHVIVRGNQRQKAFLDDTDYQVYLERLARYRRKYNYTLYAYCLMPNHVHLLLESSNQPLAKFMQGLQQSYTQYFNLRHHKVGHLFQGRYKAIICQKDEYLLELVRYIHLNPVRARIVPKPEQYRYSGYRVYLEGKPTEVVDPTKVLKILGGKQAYRRFVLDGLGEGHKEEYYQVEDQRFLGTEGFGDKLQQEQEKGPKAASKGSLGVAVKELAEHLRIGVEVLRSPDRSWAVSKARTMIAYILVRRLGYGVGEVARYLGRDMATVGTLIGRLSERMQLDEKLLQKLNKTTKIVES
ncbi:MAG: transposase [Candidatus Binatota bacterium]